MLSGTWADGTLLATTNSSEDARDILTRLSVKHGGTQEKIASVGIDSENESHLALASSEVKAAFEILDNPFNDYLALDLRDENSMLPMRLTSCATLLKVISLALTRLSGACAYSKSIAFSNTMSPTSIQTMMQLHLQ